MPWKTEIDRLVHQTVLDAAHGGDPERRRAAQALSDLLALAPERASSHFHLGVYDELIGAVPPAREGEEATTVLPASEDEALHWRHVGRLDAASRRGGAERLAPLMEDPLFEATLEHPEGRIALRAVGRPLLRRGEAARVFELYRRHLAAVDDEGSRRDAEFLLEESLRRVERGEGAEAATLERLRSAAAFAEAAGLDARARAKVDRRMGRLHQLAGRGEEAAACYRLALERLAPEDPYRSVLVGDLALATLGVRGTLDLMPVPDRPQAAEAEAILLEGQGGEGRSYNAIYTLGMLAYERGDHARAAECFQEADTLMRENRAKARIVHARSRFFLAHCRLALGAEGEALQEAQRWILKDAGAVALEPEVKGPVFDALVERVPDARVPGRPASRSPRAPEARGVSAAEHLEAAREALGADPQQTLALVDRAFKSRPDFETWHGAYALRLEALLALGETGEALRTYERFRAKLYRREAYETLEGLLQDEAGPLSRLLDATARGEELVDLYETMPGREERFVEVCVRCAKDHLEAGDAQATPRAVALLREAAVRDEAAAREMLDGAVEAARSAGVLAADVSVEDARKMLQGEDEPVRLLLVGGDEGCQPHRDRFKALAQDVGFEGDWIFTGARPPYKTLREIQRAAQDADVILIHHSTGPDYRSDVREIGEKLDVPVREAVWLGRAGLEREVLQSLRDAFVD